MNVIEMEIDGVKIIELDVFGDERGWFARHTMRSCIGGSGHTIALPAGKACNCCVR